MRKSKPESAESAELSDLHSWRRHSCLPRPHSWGRSWFDAVSRPLRVSRRGSTRQARVPAPRRQIGGGPCWSSLRDLLQPAGGLHGVAGGGDNAGGEAERVGEFGLGRDAEEVVHGADQIDRVDGAVLDLFEIGRAHV